MPLPVALVSIRLFIRLLLGILLLSVGVSKLAHPRQFQRGIQGYHIVPSLLEKKLALTALLSFGIPLAELLSGIGFNQQLLADCYHCAGNGPVRHL